MKEIEIIVINDASTDNTLEILEKLMNEDSRIKLINNEKNRRILYSKSIGALYANGKYILVLDQDDMFITEDAFDILYNNAEKNNLDTLQFRDISLKNFILENNMNYSGMILSQNTSYEIKYELKYLMFKKYNLLLWGLLIKSDLYKRAVIHLWKNIINYKIIHYED
jgi:glycosyltransferase involved in cell wall biosynthesis